MSASEDPPRFVFRHTDLSIPAENVWLGGVLSHAPDARGLVLLLDNGAGRLHEPQQQLLPQRFEAARYACMRLDLLTGQEEHRDPDARYNVPQMHHRLMAALEWAAHQPQLQLLPLAIVAAGTTAAAAIRAAAQSPQRVHTLVCLSGRPDLAGAGPLSRVQCPTRFIVGADNPEREHHQTLAYRLLKCPCDWLELPGLGAEFRSAESIHKVSRPILEWIEARLPTTIPAEQLDAEE